ncbi:methyl-accepting chemotaxis protein [Vibrio sp. JPW-9-11-11]|uniref:methyl-accepting chemotaxis protein n=1 Tax=Vibrio sp. JPW-9-11-11 TaxID=1416532 RepID=UPI0015935BE4|nr:methyl-accepting chemotaxis protein [Vibrio sp. JPW-9-11-11]NVD06495.1 methyl-accepting chemotaxis protein [Vibrio sp. JPW-9-11-11]
MKVSLNIVQRTILGYLVMFILLAALGMFSYLNLKTVDKSVSLITQQATPLLVNSAQLNSSMLKSQRLLLEYLTFEDLSVLPSIKEAFTTQQAIFNQTFDKIRHNDAIDSSKIATLAQAFYRDAEQVMSLHQSSLQAQQNLYLAQAEFVKFEDAFQRITQQLLSNLSKSRSQSNKVDRLTSGIKRDLRTLRAANPDMDLVKVIANFEKNTNLAKEGIQQVKVSAGLIKRFDTVVEKLKVAGISEKGMLPLMLSTKNLREQIRALIRKSQQNSRTLEKVFEDLAQSAVAEVTEAKVATEKSVSSAERLIIVLSVASAIVAIIIGFLTAKAIHKPLSMINRVLRLMREGDMTHKVRYESRCEFGELSHSIDKLVGEMKEVLSQINSGSKSLATQANKASEISDSTMSRVSAQGQQIDMVAAAISEMETSVTEVHRSTQRSQDEVEHANESTLTSRQQVASGLALIEELLESINTATQITTQLDQYSGNIGSILDVIRDIAEQTNLLALNAAIEAARAGEHGRGFAVVADEVRTLANRTQQSTVEIQSMIERLQSSSDEMVSVMTLSQNKTEKCVEQSRLTDETLQTVVEHMTSIKNSSTQVAHASEEQIKVSREIAQSINEISELASQTEVEAQGAASVSDALAQLAQNQRALVKRFKV